MSFCLIYFLFFSLFWLLWSWSVKNCSHPAHHFQESKAEHLHNPHATWYWWISFLSQNISHLWLKIAINWPVCSHNSVQIDHGWGLGPFHLQRCSDEVCAYTFLSWFPRQISNASYLNPSCHFPFHPSSSLGNRCQTNSKGNQQHKYQPQLWKQIWIQSLHSKPKHDNWAPE